MIIPAIKCEINASAKLHPSEDPQKVQSALLNVLSFLNITRGDEMIYGQSNDIHSLTKIHESIQSHQTRFAYKRQLKNNTDNTNTWFYLNKQAAFVDNIALCKEEDESPLGPIQINIESNDITRLIEWLVFGVDESD